MKRLVTLPAPGEHGVYVIHGCSRLAGRRVTWLARLVRRLPRLAPKTSCGLAMLAPASTPDRATAVRDCSACAAAGAFRGHNAHERLVAAWVAFHPDHPRPTGVLKLVDEASSLLAGLDPDPSAVEIMRELGSCRGLLVVPPGRCDRGHQEHTP